jgi:hypothetical protein
MDSVGSGRNTMPPVFSENVTNIWFHTSRVLLDNRNDPKRLEEDVGLRLCL